jgi:hypothetical protein
MALLSHFPTTAIAEPFRRKIMGATNDERLLTRLSTQLRKVPGVRGIVLGGSRASGTATPQSDYDLGLYYEADDPLDVGSLTTTIAALDDTGPAASVTPIGGWGPWINGGGWLTVEGKRVDLLYRDLGRVRSVIGQCRAGQIERHYQPGHPHAFVSAIYMGEIANCRPLWDPRAVMAALKGQTLPYPQLLRQGLIRTFLWEARFAIENVRHGRALDDVAYVAGCFFRSVACLCQVLFAINGTYLLNEKGAVLGTRDLAVCPENFSARVAHAVQRACNGDTAWAAQELEQLVAATEALAT